MKKILLFIFILTSTCYAQVSAIITTQKFKMGFMSSGFVTYPGGLQINQDQIVVGRFITDLNGNITGVIPSCLTTSYSLSKNGFYCQSGLKYAYFDYSLLSSIINLTKSNKSELAYGASSQYSINKPCFETPNFTGFLPNQDGRSEYGLFVNENRLQIVDSEKLLSSVEIKVYGRRWDHIHTGNGEYYALYGGENKLTLVKVDLKTGKDEYVEIDSKYAYYSGGNVEVAGDKIIVTTFHGECANKTDTYNSWDAPKIDGLLNFVISKSDMKIIEQDAIEIPSEYEALVASDKGYSYLSINDVLINKENIYILSGTRGEPFAIWKFSKGDLSFLHTIKDETYIRSGKIFNYSGRNYLLYAVDAGGGLNSVTMDKVKIAIFDDNELTEIELDIVVDKEPQGYINLSHTFITSKGVILVPGDNMYDTGYLLKIQL